MSVLLSLPPSPPTTSSRHRMSLPMGFDLSVDAPSSSPASLAPSSGANNRKRVEFSPWTTNISDTHNSSLDPSFPLASKTTSVYKDPSLRPILKSTLSNETVLGLDGQQERRRSPSSNMDSLLGQLGHDDRLSSIDAYQTISNLIRTYDEVPEDMALRSRMGLLQRYIKRDISTLDNALEDTPSEERLSLQNLVTSALKVLVVLVWSSEYSPLLTDEFCICIIDRSIQALKDHTAPKAVIIHYAHLLAIQNFRQSMMSSNNRASKILEALKEITEHISGKAIVSERLLIYQKLVDQARPIMKAKANSWVKEVLSAMAHSLKDIRNTAVSVATKACSAFQTSISLATAARDALSETVNNRALSSIITQRLDRMIAAKDDAVQVPQVWAVVLLLCNSSDMKIDSWDMLKDWLKVIQRCFNCSDTAVRLQAFLAWNRFVFVVRPHEASEHLVSMLAKPAVTQIERTGASSTSKGSRPAAVSNYCTLMYYAFRPAASHKQYTRMWNEYVVKVMTSSFLSKSSSNADLCCRIMAALLWNSSNRAKVWNEHRAHENSPVDPIELPSMDCKWLRARASAVLDILLLLVKYSSFGPSGHSDQAHVAQAWRSFVRAIRESSSKEVVTSIETKKALDSIVNFLSVCQEECLTDALIGDKDNSASRVILLCDIAIKELGITSMVEALERSTSPRNALILSELLNSVSAAMQNRYRVGHEQEMHLTLPSNLVQTDPAMLDRLLKFLNQELLGSYEAALPPTYQDLSEMMNLCIHALRQIPVAFTLKALSSLESGLVVLMKDETMLFKRTTGTGMAKVYEKFSTAIANRLIDVQVNQYGTLDQLIASVLMSPHDFVANALLESWNKATWRQEDVCEYGPELLKAIEHIQRKASVDLPGVIQPQVDETVMSEEFVQLDFGRGDTESLEIPSKVQNPTHKIKDLYVDISIPRPKSRDNGLIPGPKASLWTRPSNRTPIRKLRHQDSQIQFVAIDSSPTEVEEAESQYLTDRQKEVRDRQRGEHALNFLDLKSSPQSRPKRAQSADCEMARKVAAAAMQQVPTTPEINREKDVLDREHPPTPTPRARRLAQRTLTADILSSPASAVDSNDMMTGYDDVHYSPLPYNGNIVNDIELDNGRAGSTQIVDLLSTVYDSASMLQPGHIASNRPSPRDEVSIVTACTSGLSVEAAEVFVRESADGDVSDLMEEVLDVASPVVYSDEFDALAASQLSQDLEMQSVKSVRMSPRRHREPSIPSPLAEKKRKHKDDKMDDSQGERKRHRQDADEAVEETSPVSQSLEIQQLGTNDFIARELQDCLAPEHHNEESASQIQASRPSGRKSRRRARGRRGLGSQASRNSSVLSTPPSSPSDKEVTSATGSFNSRDDDPESRDFETAQETIPTIDKHIRHAAASAESVDIEPNILTSEVQESIIAPQDPASAIPKSMQMDSEAANPSAGAMTDVMTDLQRVLERLKHQRSNSKSSINLRAIDDLCFQIRFEAQIVAQQQGR